MTRFLAAAALAAALATPTFAQDAATALCSDYATMDNAGKMAMLAELQSLNAEMASGQSMSSDEIATALNTQCAANPDQLVSDAMKEIHKM